MKTDQEKFIECWYECNPSGQGTYALALENLYNFLTDNGENMDWDPALVEEYQRRFIYFADIRDFFKEYPEGEGKTWADIPAVVVSDGAGAFVDTELL